MKTTKGKGFKSLVKPLVAATALAGAGYVLALTEAGTVIKNLATVTYTDNNGDSYTATSNEAQVTVANVFTATLASDNVGGEAAPGQTVYFPHVLTNTGNVADTYTLTAVDDTGTGAAGTIAAGGFAIYLDENGNGQPDAGEQIVGSVTLEPGEEANLIVAVDVPTTASASDVVDAILTATSSNAGADVEDITPNGSGDGIGGLDNDDGESDTNSATNQNNVTVTLGPVLVATKSSVINTGAETLQYTLTVKNTGGSAATNVDIFDTIPADTSFVSIDSVNGLLPVNGDSHYQETSAAFDGDLVDFTNVITNDFNETDNVDMDGDASLGEATQNGFVFRDASLPANTTVSIVYTVSYTGAAAGEDFKNRFCVGEDIQANATAEFDFPADLGVCSNETIDRIPFTYSIDADDTDGVGNDQDGVDDDVQFRTSAPLGSNVDFENVITNNGTASDIVDVEIAVDTFPAGTVFTFWEQGGVVPLTDNNNNGIPDTGVIGAGSSLTIVVRAAIPQGVVAGEVIANPAGSTITGGTVTSTGSVLYLEKATAAQQLPGADGQQGSTGQDFDINTADEVDDDEAFVAVLQATSSEDNSQIDYKIEALGAISLPVVDLANADASVDADLDDSGTANAQPVTATPTMTFGNDDLADSLGGTDGAASGNGASGDAPVTIGQTVFFPLYVANEGGNVDAYTLSHTGGTGLDIVFVNTSGTQVADDSTTLGNTATDEVITATPALSAGEVFKYFAAVTVTDAAVAGDIDITFTVTSATTSATDSKLDRVVVALACDMGITPASQQQIQAGGNVDYVHTLTNSSNVTGTYTFAVALSDGDWTSLLVAESFNGGSGTHTDGGNGAIDSGEPLEADATVTLAPGQSFTFTNRLFAPATAIAAQTEVSTVTITAGGAAAACGGLIVEDVASVIVGQMRLDKAAALDADCNCTADVAFAVDGGNVTPGECVVWQLVATNEGDEVADNVVINDSTTEFSVMHENGTFDGSFPGGPSSGVTAGADQFKACITQSADVAACTPATLTSGGAAGADGETVTFATPAVTFTFGTINPGESATAEFCVQVQ